MGEEKSLIKIEKLNIFQKVMRFFENLFKKNKNFDNVVENDSVNTNIKDKFEQERKILNMQKDLESGLIEEDRLTDKEKELLVDLYKKQIKNKKEAIQYYERELQRYKERILLVKSKLQ